MELLTERLRLRSCREEDLKPLAAAIAPPAVSDWLCNLPRPYTLADAREFMQRTAAPGAGWEGIIALRDSDALIGGVRLTQSAAPGEQPVLAAPSAPAERQQPREATLGYWVARARWGKGYATEAASALLAWGFRELKLERVSASTLPGNRPSQAVLRRLGFAYVGMRLAETGACGPQRVPHYLLERPTH
ncbi:MAG: hypothetical protein CL960_03545 [Euryarchaeota archaeon]|jgi:RimJ/RimL family protein N-acetyltransferase|nr:hypothetical protein [Euryarchaeota archaeon]MDP6364175.1 GNAT family N-acetyltransferase [Candidatus Poseidoniia archaeon]MDP7007682.1 GNAT family N-acetyltransferase [Candidatus Poseidoniia archaeon]|tara:strand:+ start:4955 stop:5524 length:570 start_codon:yes stop_codon:yes gene_type:complete